MADYQHIRKLGEGYFGEVWLVEDRALGGLRAVKFVREANIPDPSDFYKEPQILQHLQHQHVVRVTDAGKTSAGRLYIAMEYHPSGSLEDEVRGSTAGLNAPISVGCQIARALDYAHGLSYLHRDVKAANVLISENGDYKLSDFGLATNMRRAGGASPQGYLTHLAPEVVGGLDCSIASDIYALAVTIYRLINGEGMMPEYSDVAGLQDMIVNGKFPDRTCYQPFVPHALREAINKAMNLDPARRFKTAGDFRHVLERVPI